MGISVYADSIRDFHWFITVNCCIDRHRLHVIGNLTPCSPDWLHIYGRFQWQCWCGSPCHFAAKNKSLKWDNFVFLDKNKYCLHLKKFKVSCSSVIRVHCSPQLSMLGVKYPHLFTLKEAENFILSVKKESPLYSYTYHNFCPECFNIGDYGVYFLSKPTSSGHLGNCSCCASAKASFPEQ